MMANALSVSAWAKRSLAADLVDLSVPRAPIVEQEAVEIAFQRYGLVGRVQRFATEKDDTFLLDAAHSGRFILKIAHPSERSDELDLQVAVLRHLEVQAPAVPVPRMLPDVTGSYLSSVEAENGEDRAVRLMTFIPGTVLDRSTATGEQRSMIGETLADLRHALSDFSHPADTRIVAWDVCNLLGFVDLIDHVADPQHRLSVEKALRVFADIEPRLSGLRRQVLHNDLNTSNVVVDDTNPCFVNGIIDFGDTVRTAVAVDVSTALMNQMPKVLSGSDRHDLFDEARSLLRGYLRRADLDDDELTLIPFLAMGRVALRGLLTSWRAALFPENAAYITRNTAAGWGHLDWFLSLSRDQISDLLADFRSEGGREP